MSVLFRWIHVIAGITWIGLLYYFNWMNGHIAATFDADTKKKVVPELMPRVLYWFRWGAAFTWVTGILLMMLVFYHGGLMFEGDQGWHGGAFAMLAVTFLGVFVYDALFKAIKAQQPLGAIFAFALTALVIFLMVKVGKFGYRAYVIHLGALFGTCMAYNVWYRIWPAQQRIITAIKGGNAPNPDDAAMAGLRSKHNTYMSVPLVWAMLNTHTVTVGSSSYCYLIGAVAVGWLVVYLLYKKSATVKGF